MSEFWPILWAIIKYTAIFGGGFVLTVLLIAIFHPIRFTLNGRASVKGQRGEVVMSYLFSLLHIRYIATRKAQSTWLEFCGFKTLLDHEEFVPHKARQSEVDNTEEATMENTESQSVTGSETSVSETSELLDTTKPESVAEATEPQTSTESEPAEEASEPQTTTKSEAAAETSEAQTTTDSEAVTETSESQTATESEVSEETADSQTATESEAAYETTESTTTTEHEVAAEVEVTEAPITTEPEVAVEATGSTATTVAETAVENAESKVSTEQETTEPEKADEPKPAKSDDNSWQKKLRKFKKDFNRRYNQLRGRLRLLKQKWNSLWPVVKRFWNRGKKGFRFYGANLMVRYSLDDHCLTGMLYGYLAPMIGFAQRYGLSFMPVPAFPETPGPGIYAKASWNIEIKPYRLLWAITALLFEKNLYKEAIWLYKEKKKRKNK